MDAKAVPGAACAPKLDGIEIGGGSGGSALEVVDASNTVDVEDELDRLLSCLGPIVDALALRSPALSSSVSSAEARGA